MVYPSGCERGAYRVTDERLTLRQAAARLGVSESAIRKRVERGTLRSDKGTDGRRYVYLDTGADASATHERDALMSERIEELRDEVHYLRDQLHQELERRSAEAERYQQIVAALTTANASLSERLRALEPPQEPPSQPRESPETVEAEQELDTERARREMAETTLREGMDEERRRREEAERERDELRRELYARRRSQEASETAEEQQGRGEPRPATEGPQESSEDFEGRGSGTAR
jgi:hypothetical protein